MKEIKFRAFDKENGEWIYAEPIYGFFPSVGGLTDAEYKLMNDEDRFGDIQQFTGLKDKNGKEIYEGDVVKDEFDNKNKVQHDQGYVGDDRAVFYHTGFEFHGDPDKLEIIGNIHENPELVK